MEKFILNRRSLNLQGSSTNNTTATEEPPLITLVSSSVKNTTTAASKKSTTAGGAGISLLSGSRTTGKATKTTESRPKFKGTSIDEALEILKSQPDYENLVKVLRYLDKDGTSEGGGQLTPQAAQVARVLVQEIAPNYWTVLKEVSSSLVSSSSLSADGEKQKKGTTRTKHNGEDDDDAAELFLDALRSLTGINAILLHLVALAKEGQRGHREMQRREDVAMNIHVTLEVLCEILRGDSRIGDIWARSVHGLDAPVKRRVVWGQYLSLFGGEKMVSVTAEAEEVGNREGREGKERLWWVADGQQFATWKARNLVEWAREEVISGDGEEAGKKVAELLVKSGKGARSENLLKNVLIELVFRNGKDLSPFRAVIGHLPSFEQQKVISVILRILTDKHLSALDPGNEKTTDQLVSAAAGVLKAIVRDNTTYIEHLVSWLTSTSGAGLGDGIAIRRAVVAVLAEHGGIVTATMEKLMALFGDMIYVKHSPILQQEAHAQALLLCAGYVKRFAPVKLTILLRGTTFLESVSTRLAAPQLRARFLGMVVGEALSGLVDVAKKKLDFQMAETKTAEGAWYKSLVQIEDVAGDPSSLLEERKKEEPLSSAEVLPKPAPTKKTKARPKTTVAKPKKETKPVMPLAATTRPTGFIIEEVSDSGEENDDGQPGSKNNGIEEVGDDSDDDDLVPYAKPDNDSSDSEEDPTMLNRNKPHAPVYIRDLILFLRATDDYDRTSLALTTAASLIRRKANFGSELRDHAIELANLLCGVQDGFEIEGFEDMRTEAMAALIVAQTENMGGWFARTLVEGDYNVVQRSGVLVAMGMAGREVAGLAGARGDEFVSKRLPAKMEAMFLGRGEGEKKKKGGLKGLPPTALDSITSDITARFIAPMAAEAADSVTGPDILKLGGSFKDKFSASSSRQQQQQQKQQKQKQLEDKKELKAGGAAHIGPGRIIRQPQTTRPSPIKSIPNTSAQLIAISLFLPLSGRLLPIFVRKSCPRTSSSNRDCTTRFTAILPLALRTLSVLLHAAGPNTLALPELTGEMLNLLLAARRAATGDLGLTGAVVEALVVLLGVNGIGSGGLGSTGGVGGAMEMGWGVNETKLRDFVMNWGREIGELGEWVGGVFEGLRGPGDGRVSGIGGGGVVVGGDEEENRVKALAAGVLVRLGEVREKVGVMMTMSGL